MDLERLVLDHLHLASAGARAGGPPATQGDRFQDACVGLLHAARRYDATRGPFAPFARWWIRQAVTRGIRQQAVPRLSRHAAEWLPAYYAVATQADGPTRLDDLAAQMAQWRAARRHGAPSARVPILGADTLARVVQAVAPPLSLDQPRGGDARPLADRLTHEFDAAAAAADAEIARQVAAVAPSAWDRIDQRRRLPADVLAALRLHAAVEGLGPPAAGPPSAPPPIPGAALLAFPYLDLVESGGVPSEDTHGQHGPT